MRTPLLGLPCPSPGNTGAVPLYACDRCGFTSTAFRVDAARTHRAEYPQCEGTVQIIFRSDERTRSVKRDLLSGARQTAAPATAAQASPDPRRRTFEMCERLDADATLRLIVLGDLDIVTDKLTARLRELHTTGHSVRLDLSQLAFIDSSGSREREHGRRQPADAPVLRPREPACFFTFFGYMRGSCLAVLQAHLAGSSLVRQLDAELRGLAGVALPA